jgi:hypothetical protein
MRNCRRDLFRRPGRDDLAAGVAAFGAQIDDPVDGLDHFEIVLDHHHRPRSHSIESSCGVGRCVGSHRHRSRGNSFPACDQGHELAERLLSEIRAVCNGYPGGLRWRLSRLVWLY